MIATWTLAALALIAVPLAVRLPLGLAPLIGVGGAAALVAVWRTRGWRRLLTPLTAILAVAAVWMLLSASWAISSADALSTARGVILTLLAILLLLTLEPADHRWLQWASALGLAIGIAILLPTLLIAPHGTYNRAASLLALLLAPVAWTHRPWIGGALLAVGLATLACAEGSSVKVAAMAGLGAAALAYLHRHIVAAFGVLAAVAIVAMPLLIPGPERLTALKFSAVHRAHIWHFVSERIAEHPWRGWGLDASRSMPGAKTLLPGIDPKDVQGEANAVMLPLHPHNGALQVWLELGLPGALLLGALAFLVYRGASEITSAGARAAATAAITVALVVGCLSFGIWQNWWIAALGLAAVLGRHLVRA
jgi:exopolysaccharide production protein ExoQ